MSGLILKDFLNLKRYIKQVSFIFIVYAFLAINMGDPAYIIFIMILVTSMMVISSIAYDEKAKWDKYALTMPITKKMLVQSKYLLLVILSVGGGIFSFLFGTILAIYLKIDKTKELILTSGGVVLASLTLFSILLPIIFKLGTEKARMIMIGIFAIPTILTVMISKLMNGITLPQFTPEQLRYLAYASPIVVLIILIISYTLSVAIMEKKDF